jgi:hypothetical protein
MHLARTYEDVAWLFKTDTIIRVPTIQLGAL